MKEALLQRLVNKFIWNTGRAVNLEDPRRPIDGITVEELFNGHTSKSGKSVNTDNALTISALWRAIQILGGAASSIPSKPYKRNDNGRDPLKNHPTVNIFTNRVNAKYTTPVWWDRVIHHLHQKGNHYAYPIRNELGQVVELRLENPDDVTVYEDRYDVLYKIKGDEKVYHSHEFIHVPHLGDGIVGKSTVAYAREDLGLEMSRRDYGSGIYASGGQVQGLLKPPQYLDKTKREEAIKAWNEQKKKGGDIIPPFGFDYIKMGFKPDEMEFLGSGNFSIATISRWTGVPRHLLFDPEGNSYNSNEQAGIEFLQYSIAPILIKIEYEYSSKIYQLPREQNNYLEFEMDGYVRVDTATKIDAMVKQVHGALMKPSEGRQKLNMPFAEGSDQLMINSGSIPLRLMDQFVLKKSDTQKVSDEKKAKLKELLNGKTDEALKILES